MAKALVLVVFAHLFFLSQFALSQTQRTYCESILTQRTLVDLPYSLNKNGFDDKSSQCEQKIISADKLKHNFCDFKNFKEPGKGISYSVVNGMAQFSILKKNQFEGDLPVKHLATLTPKDKNNKSVLVVTTQGGTQSQPRKKFSKLLKNDESEFLVGSSDYKEETTYTLNEDCKIERISFSKKSKSLKFSKKVLESKHEKYTLNSSNCKILKGYSLNLKKMNAEIIVAMKNQSNRFTFESRTEIKGIEEKYRNLAYPSSSRFSELGFYTQYFQEADESDFADVSTKLLWQNIYEGCSALKDELVSPAEMKKNEKRLIPEPLVLPDTKI